MTYRVQLSAQTRQIISEIRDLRVRAAIISRAEKLAIDPHLQGKPLGDELRGYYSVRAAGQRYRIIYRVEQSRVFVLVVFVGRRREGSRDDVYEQT